MISTKISRQFFRMSSRRLFWVDCEMTGLDFLGKDRIMEIACIVTDENLDIVKEGPALVFKISDDLLESMDDWCRKTHGDSGLTEKCKNSTLSIADGDEIVSKFIAENCPNCPLAGNSVHADARFMYREMPKSMKELSYRIVDVSTVKELCKRWYPEVYKNMPSKNSESAVGGSHTAKYDIIKSIEEMRIYQEKLFIKPENM